MANVLLVLGLLGQLLLPCQGLGVTLVQRRGDWFWRRPPPASQADDCLTAKEGDRCHKAVKYAVEKGYSRHPHWYPEYKHSGVMDLDMMEMQMVLHKLKKAGCAMPCQFDEKAVDQYIEATGNESNVTEFEEIETSPRPTTTPLMPMVDRKLEDLSLDDLSKYLKRPEELDAYVGKIGGKVTPAKQVQTPTDDGDNGHSTDPNHPTDGGQGSTDGSRGKPPSGSRGKAEPDPNDGDNGHSTDPNHPTDGGQGSTDGSKDKPSRAGASQDQVRSQLAALGAERRKAERLVQAQRDDYDQLLADRPPAWSSRSAAVEGRLEALSAHRQQAEKRMQQLEGRLDELAAAAGIDPAEAAKIEAQR